MNAARTLPTRIDGCGDVVPYAGRCLPPPGRGAAPGPAKDGGAKLLADIGAAFDACAIRDGATLSFHHHLRNSDAVLNRVMAESAARGLRGLTVAASSLFPVHEPLVAHLAAAS